MLKSVGLAMVGIVTLVATSATAQVAGIERFAAPPPTQDEVLLQVEDTLANSRHYCLDIPGWGVLSQSRTGWRTDWPLEAHTCKTGIAKSHYFIVDQLVSRAELLGAGGRIRFSRFDLCAEVMKVGDGDPVREDALVLLASCSDSPRQQFTLAANGEIRSRLDPAKCLTIGGEAHEAGNRAPGEPWYQRALTITTCGKVDTTRQKWRLTTPPADPS